MVKPILSAVLGTNADLFPEVLRLHVPDGSRVLDMTYGKGTFWKKVDRTQYALTTNDLFSEADIHADFAGFPFEDATFNVIILDPPYFRTNNTAGKMAMNYANQRINIRTHAGIIEMYVRGIQEARRLLVPGGVLIVKCQDEIESRKPKWTHFELTAAAEGFELEDLFVLVTKHVLVSPKHRNQQHARKNHSYFLVFRKN
jgi:tRNA G10  N-methylase Trm11